MTDTVRHHVINLLQGPTVRRIRFSFPRSGTTFSLAALHFHRVARAIQTGNIAVHVTTAIPADAAATYDSVNKGSLHGVINIRPQYIGRGAEADIVHECTHAIFDLERTGITALDDEAAAYVCGGLYARMSGLAQSRWDSPIRTVARTVVDDILAAYARGAAAIPAVEPARWHAVRGIIPIRPAYIGGPAATGGSYTHDG